MLLTTPNLLNIGNTHPRYSLCVMTPPLYHHRLHPPQLPSIRPGPAPSPFRLVNRDAEIT